MSTVVCIITKNVLIYVVINNVLTESQCGFLAGRGTTDIIFEMRTIQQMYLEQNKDLYMVFIDLTKVLIQSTEQGSGNCLQNVGTTSTNDTVRTFRTYTENHQNKIKLK